MFLIEKSEADQILLTVIAVKFVPARSSLSYMNTQPVYRTQKLSK